MADPPSMPSVEFSTNAGVAGASQPWHTMWPSNQLQWLAKARHQSRKWAFHSAQPNLGSSWLIGNPPIPGPVPLAVQGSEIKRTLCARMTGSSAIS